MQGLDIPPTLGDELFSQPLDHSLDVLRQLLRGELGRPDSDGGSGGGGELHRGTVQSPFDLLGDNQRGRKGAVLVLCNPCLRILLDLFTIHLFDLSDADRDGPLAGLVENLPKRLDQAHDNAIISQEDIMLGQQLSPALEALVPRLQFREADHPVDTGGEILRERRVGDDVLDRALRVRGDQTDGRRGVESVGDADFAGLQAVLVHNVLFGGEHKPDGFVVKGRVLVVIFVIISNQSFLCRSLFFFLLF